MKTEPKKSKPRLLRKIWLSIKEVFITIDNIFSLVRERVGQSVRMQLITTFIICLLGAMVVTTVSSSILSNFNKQAIVDYSSGAQSIDYYARTIVQELTNYNNEKTLQKGNQQDYELEWEKHVENILNRKGNEIKALIVDIDGNVLYRSENATENQVDLHNLIRNAMNTRIDSYRFQERAEFISFYPVTLKIKNIRAYVITSGVPEATIVYVSRGDGFIPIILGFATFIIVFYFSTQYKMRYIEELADGLLEISKGNLNYRVIGKSEDELGSLADNINFMAEELQNKIEEERRAEQIKNELITNVSHDLRTPLTSIVGYLSLLQNEKYENKEEYEQYLDIVYCKAEKLKILAEDLFEYTKVINKGTQLSLETININELIDQLAEELVPLLDEKQLSFKKEFSKEKARATIDTDKMVRVFENLLINSIKYSKGQSEILIKTTVDDQHITICFENKGEHITKEDLERIFDRFFKVEKSRTSDSSGSGLGLAISKNLVLLHNGEIWSECQGDTIRFFIKLSKAN